MPPLEMRGRYIQREWFSDTELQTKLSADVREFYFGLAMLADDEGWLPRDVVGIGASIYRFRGTDERNRLVRANLEVLTGLGKVRSHRCKCLFLPTVARMGRAGNKNRVHLLIHRSHLAMSSSNGQNVQPGLDMSSDVQPGLDTQPVLTLPDLTRRGRGRAEGAAPRSGRMERINGEWVALPGSKP